MTSLPTIKHPFLDQSEAANLCGVNKLTVFRWIDDGLLKCVEFPIAVRPGSPQRPFRRKVHRAELAAFMKRHRIPECPADGSRRAEFGTVWVSRGKKRMRPVVSTRVVSIACQVKQKVAARWIDEGLIPAHHENAGEFRAHRRVLRAHLIAFMEGRGYSSEAIEVARTID